MAGSTALLSLAVLLAVFEIGSCVRCYQCTSQQNRACADPFTEDDRLLTDCGTQDSVNFNRNYLSAILPSSIADGTTGAPRFCHKIVYQDGNVVRTCLDGNPTNMNNTCVFIDNYSKTNLLNGKPSVKHCSVCNKDKCNGAASISYSIPLALIALVASFMYYKQ